MLPLRQAPPGAPKGAGRPGSQAEAPLRPSASPSSGRSGAKEGAGAASAADAKKAIEAERIWWSEASERHVKQLESTFGDEFTKMRERLRSEISGCQDRLEFLVQTESKQRCRAIVEVKRELDVQQATLAEMRQAQTELERRVEARVEEAIGAGGARSDATDAVARLRSDLDLTQSQRCAQEASVRAGLEDLRRSLADLQEAVASQQLRGEESVQALRSELAGLRQQARADVEAQASSRTDSEVRSLLQQSSEELSRSIRDTSCAVTVSEQTLRKEMEAMRQQVEAADSARCSEIAVALEHSGANLSKSIAEERLLRDAQAKAWMSRLDTIQEQLENLKTTRVAAQPMDLEQSIASSEHVRALNGLIDSVRQDVVRAGDLEKSIASSEQVQALNRLIESVRQDVARVQTAMPTDLEKSIASSERVRALNDMIEGVRQDIVRPADLEKSIASSEHVRALHGMIESVRQDVVRAADLEKSIAASEQVRALSGMIERVRQDALRAADLEKSIASSEQVRALGGMIEEARRDVVRVETTLLADLEKSIASSEQVKALSGMIEGVRQEVARVETALPADLEKSIASSEQVKALNGLIESVRQEVARVETKLPADLEKSFASAGQVQALNGLIERVQQEVARVESSLPADLKRTLASNEEVQVLHKLVGTVREDIARIEVSVPKEIERSMSSMKRLESLHESVSALRQDVDRVEASQAALPKPEQTVSAAQLEDLRSLVGRVEREAASCRAEDAQRAREEAVELRMGFSGVRDELRADLDRTVAECAEIRAGVEAVRVVVGNLERASQDDRSAVAEMARVVREAAASCAAVAPRLDALEAEIRRISSAEMKLSFAQEFEELRRSTSETMRSVQEIAFEAIKRAQAKAPGEGLAPASSWTGAGTPEGAGTPAGDSGGSSALVPAEFQGVVAQVSALWSSFRAMEADMRRSGVLTMAARVAALEERVAQHVGNFDRESAALLARAGATEGEVQRLSADCRSSLELILAELQTLAALSGERLGAVVGRATASGSTPSAASIASDGLVTSRPPMLVDAIGRVEGSLSDSTLRSLTPELRSSIASIVQRVSETLNLQPAAAHDVILDAVGIAKLQASRQDSDASTSPGGHAQGDFLLALKAVQELRQKNLSLREANAELAEELMAQDPAPPAQAAWPETYLPQSPRGSLGGGAGSVPHWRVPPIQQQALASPIVGARLRDLRGGAWQPSAAPARAAGSPPRRRE